MIIFIYINFISHQFHFTPKKKLPVATKSTSIRTLIESRLYSDVVLDHIIVFDYHSNTWKHSCNIPHHHSPSTSYQSKLVSLFIGRGRSQLSRCFYSASFSLPNSRLQPCRGDPLFSLILRGCFCYKHNGIHCGPLLCNSPTPQIHTHNDKDNDQSPSYVGLAGAVNSRYYSHTRAVK